MDCLLLHNIMKNTFFLNDEIFNNSQIKVMNLFTMRWAFDFTRRTKEILKCDMNKTRMQTKSFHQMTRKKSKKKSDLYKNCNAVKILVFFLLRFLNFKYTKISHIYQSDKLFYPESKGNLLSKIILWATTLKI